MKSYRIYSETGIETIERVWFCAEYYKEKSATVIKRKTGIPRSSSEYLHRNRRIVQNHIDTAFIERRLDLISLVTEFLLYARTENYVKLGKLHRIPSRILGILRHS